jgi:flagellar basal-body rod protein FlgF
VEALVNMISLARNFDMQMKMLQTADTNAQHATSVISLAG